MLILIICVCKKTFCVLQLVLIGPKYNDKYLLGFLISLTRFLFQHLNTHLKLEVVQNHMNTIPIMSASWFCRLISTPLWFVFMLSKKKLKTSFQFLKKTEAVVELNDESRIFIQSFS